MGRLEEERPHDTTNLPDSSSWEERFTCASSQGVTEEQEDKGSNDVEPRVISEGRSSETEGEVSEGASPEGLMDDDK